MPPLCHARRRSPLPSSHSTGNAAATCCPAHRWHSCRRCCHRCYWAPTAAAAAVATALAAPPPLLLLLPPLAAPPALLRCRRCCGRRNRCYPAATAWRVHRPWAVCTQMLPRLLLLLQLPLPVCVGRCTLLPPPHPLCLQRGLGGGATVPSVCHHHQPGWVGGRGRVGRVGCPAHQCHPDTSHHGWGVGGTCHLPPFPHPLAPPPTHTPVPAPMPMFSHPRAASQLAAYPSPVCCCGAWYPP